MTFSVFTASRFPVLLLGLFCMALLLVGWRRQREQRRLASAMDMLQRVAGCRLLLRVQHLLQQHRGLSTAWLAGDDSFLARQQEKATALALCFPELMLFARQEGRQVDACLNSNQFSLFVFRWQCLLDELPELTPEQAIARHNQLIARLLEWLARLGELRIEPSTPDGAALAAVRNFVFRLPLLAESLGQLRAIGSCVAVRRRCAPVARVRMMFLIGRAESLLEQAAAGDGVAGLSAKSRYAIEAMAVMVRTRMLLSGERLPTANDYFALTTEAIDEVFVWIEASAQAVLLAQCGEQDDLEND